MLGWWRLNNVNRVDILEIQFNFNFQPTQSKLIKIIDRYLPTDTQFWKTSYAKGSRYLLTSYFVVFDLQQKRSIYQHANQSRFGLIVKHYCIITAKRFAVKLNKLFLNAIKLFISNTFNFLIVKTTAILLRAIS